MRAVLLERLIVARRRDTELDNVRQKVPVHHLGNVQPNTSVPIGALADAGHMQKRQDGICCRKSCARLQDAMPGIAMTTASTYLEHQLGQDAEVALVAHDHPARALEQTISNTRGGRGGFLEQTQRRHASGVLVEVAVGV